MGWILGLVATVVVFVAGVAGFAYVALYKINKCQLDQ